ncbi:MAG: DUF3127 domain-containing protein [Bacteroidota bacterium]|nr:DUF3127 domain-containing protein [Bacteroidota bacterium]MDX5429987.1 DUF3127 domain-containing protein [Bacteroidota bacterium]MDX5468760.1 DUF3127 domain-containing protein [Bacteroidota bacterium]
MSLEVTGRIVQVMDEVNGQSPRGSWKKQEFVIETAEQYPKKICLSVWGEKVDALKQFKEGSNITASINIESREYNGRWYTDIRAWRLQAAEAGAPGEFEAHPQEFNQETSENYTATEADDLPF